MKQMEFHNSRQKHNLLYRSDFNKLVQFLRVSMSKSMTHPTLSRKGLAIEVSCCVNTQTDKLLCLPENANSINLFDRFFRSLDTAQSSRMINVFVPEKQYSAKV